MTNTSSYGSPNAFRRALTDRLKAKAANGPWTLPQLQRQIAYDRLLERLYFLDDSWIVKGAVALLARDLSTRATLDIDLYGETPLDVSEGKFREAAHTDIGDWFRFELAPSRPILDGSVGQRISVEAYIGAQIWVSFSVDLVGPSVTMVGHPEKVPALARVGMPGVAQHGYRVYPIVDHVADKIAAIFERYGNNSNVSTRYKDLVDLVSIVRAARIPASLQSEALRMQFQRRGLSIPSRFEVPDASLWEPGYRHQAAEANIPVAGTLAEALDFVRPFIDPLLNGTAKGEWNPDAHAWA